MVKNTRFLTAALCILTLWCLAATAEEPKESLYTLTVSMPIFRSSTQHIDLDVTIPKTFRPIQTAAQAAITHQLQFILKEDTPNDWTQMIVLQILGKQNIDATQFTQLIIDKVNEKGKNIKILTQNTKSEAYYQTSTLGIYYETGNRREISYMNYYSSAGHLSGIQYVRVLTANEKPEAVIEAMIMAVEKIAKVKDKTVGLKPGLNV